VEKIPFLMPVVSKLVIVQKINSMGKLIRKTM
jgi:hypothetical protein